MRVQPCFAASRVGIMNKVNRLKMIIREGSNFKNLTLAALFSLPSSSLRMSRALA